MSSDRSKDDLPAVIRNNVLKRTFRLACEGNISLNINEEDFLGTPVSFYQKQIITFS